ncbi:MAG: glycine cleavage system protein GcvH [Thermoplasmataceae archaeon]
MYSVPEDLRYTKTHEWFKVEGNVAIVGITDYAQHQLTDIVYVEFPKKDSDQKSGERLLTIESVKSAEDVFSPVSGKLIEVNQEVSSKPELLNQDPYKNWLVKIRTVDMTVTGGLSASEYKRLIAE